MSHRNARLTPHGRRLLVDRVRSGQPVARFAKAMGVSRQCAHRWINRFDEAGDDGLEDRSSRPHSSPTRTAPDVEERVLQARRQRRCGPDQLAPDIGAPARTITRTLRRNGVPRLHDCDPLAREVIRASKTTAIRYERDRPGELAPQCQAECLCPACGSGDVVASPQAGRGLAEVAPRTAITAKETAMSKIVRIAAVAALLALAPGAAGTALATHRQPDHQVPIQGTVLGEHWVDPPPGPDGWQFFSAGTGQMSHLGRIDYFLEQSSSFRPDGVVISTGTVTFTAANGDTLVIAQEVTSEIVGDLEGFTLAGTWTVVDGSGRFADAAGSGSMDGVGDVPGGDALFGLPDGAAQFDFTGGIAYDASDRSS